jgi:aldehyde:ferredoxin oxidoreductase
LVRVPEGEGRYKGPEYETLALLGSNLDNSSLEHIIEWNHLCDELGMDTISTGAVLGTAMELAEKGLLGCDLRFGEPTGVARTLSDIAYRRGLGDLLAQGALSLAQSRGVPEIAPHSKGMELPAYHPRFGFGHALGYATANRGGCHLNGGYLTFFEGTGFSMMDPYAWRGKASLVVLMQNLMEGVSSAGGCVFSVFMVLPSFLGRYIDRPFPSPIARVITASLPLMRALDHVPNHLLSFNLPVSYFPFPRALEAVTGERFTLGRLLESGERIWNLERLLNLREGMDPRGADTLPGRMIGDDESAEGEDVPIDKMMPEYYRARGWDTGGRPKPKTLNRLGLENMSA